jgi:hypothetical protein
LKELQRAIALGNPIYPDKNDIRVMRIDAISIYDAQARQQVREAIRILCTSYKDFDSIFLAFGDVVRMGCRRSCKKL